jgi:hypothetical protein
MSRGLRSLGESGLSPSSPSNPSSPPASTSSGGNNSLGFIRSRQAGPPNIFVPNATNVLNTPIRPGVPIQIPNINTFETTDQQPRHVRALANTHSTNPPELGRKTTSSITRNPSSTKRKPKLTPTEKARIIEEKIKSINEKAVQYIHKNPEAKKKAEEELSAERSDRATRLNSAEHARKYIDYEGNKDIYRENMLFARSHVKPESLVNNMKIARQYVDPEVRDRNLEIARQHTWKGKLLDQLPEGSREIAIAQKLNREEVRLRLDLTNSKQLQSMAQNLVQNPPEGPIEIPRQLTQGSSTTQSPTKKGNPDDSDIIDF